MNDLRVVYDKAETVDQMIGWLVDADTIELRDLARNLLADVETLKAQIAAAETTGYARACARLRAIGTENYHPAGETALLIRQLANALEAGLAPVAGQTPGGTDG